MLTMAPARIALLNEGDAAVLDLRGEIDVSCAAMLRDRLVEAEATGATKIVVDVRHASFFDSSGIAILIRASTRVASRGMQLVLRAPSDSTWRILRLTGLVNRFQIVT